MIKFEIAEKPEFIEDCALHPNSQFLLIEENGIKSLWCLECIVKILKEHNTRQWDVETISEKLIGANK